MKTFNILWINLNWIEFVAYIIIPSSIIITILLYVFFNLREIRLTLEMEDSSDLIDKLDKELESKNKEVKNNMNMKKENISDYSDIIDKI